MDQNHDETMDLLHRAANGDQQGWSDLANRYRDRLYRMVAARIDRRLQRRVEASDIVQEAYAEAAQHLAEYLDDPSDTACVVMTADKLDGRAKLAKTAKKKGYLIDAKPLRGQELREFIRAEATAREHNIAPQAIETLLDAVGDDLAAIDDAMERLSLFVGAGQRIDADAVMRCVTRIRVESIWSLVDAIGLKDRRKGVAAAQSLLDDREPPLRLLAMVARQLRIVARMREALSEGLRPQEAAKRAGAPPFKASDLTESARRFTADSLGRAFALIAETDRALKGSKRPPDVILQDAVLELCADRR